MAKKKTTVKKNTEQTSKEVASTASKLLKDKESTKEVKKVAGSALTQAPNKPKPAQTKKKKG